MNRFKTIITFFKDCKLEWYSASVSRNYYAQVVHACLLRSMVGLGLSQKNRWCWLAAFFMNWLKVLIKCRRLQNHPIHSRVSDIGNKQRKKMLCNNHERKQKALRFEVILICDFISLFVSGTPLGTTVWANIFCLFIHCEELKQNQFTTGLVVVSVFVFIENILFLFFISHTHSSQFFHISSS